ncbi:MAG: hypothetical protein U0230_15710 [Polyangiales bacterium]
MKSEASETLRRTLIAMTMAALGAAAGCKGDPAPAETPAPTSQASAGGETSTNRSSASDAPAGSPASATTTAGPVSNETACGHGACS